jgi:hypothetical protein
MSYKQVPAFFQNLFHITLEMLAGNFSRQQIAGPRIMATLSKGLTNNSREFTGH